MRHDNLAKRWFFLVLLLLGMQLPGLCEQDPLRLGQVTQEELKMKVYPQDTSAAAVVLYDYEESSFLFTKGVQLQFKRTIRIKVLKKAGLDKANIVIPYYKRGSETEEIKMLKGFTYDLENGKITKVKLDETDVFDEKLDANWYLKKLSMPSVKVGSVLEYTYTIKSDFMSNLREWEFQADVPVLWSEYRVDMVPFYEYKQVVHGFLPFHIKDASVVRKTAAIAWERDAGILNIQERGSISMDVVQYRWVMKDVPAFMEEPFLPNASDYVAKLAFELSKIQFPDQKPRFTTGNWEDFTTELLKEEEFGGQLASAPYLKKIAETAVAGETKALEQAKAILRYVQATMRWDGKHRIYAENLRKAHDKRSGSSSEINLLLTALLREAGIDAQPVLVSTRSHGKPFTESPMLSKFNYVISCARVGDKEYLLDATEPGLPLGMLPFRCLNGKGWVAQAPAGRWVPLQGLSRNVQMVTAQMVISPTGEVAGPVEETFQGVPALQLRSKIQEKGKATYLKELGNAGADWARQEVALQNLEELEEPLKTSYRLARAGGSQPTDLLYLSPMLLHGQQDNPFKQATRTLPVDFDSPIDETYIFSFQLPAGYEVEELPQGSVLTLPNNAAKFTYMAQEVNGKLQVMSRLNISKTFFTPAEYGNLREFFNRMVAKHAEKVVLRKKS